jgi:hypothetical protein
MGGGKWWVGWMNMVQIMYTCVCKCKKVILFETVPGIRRGGDEREQWRG